MHEYSIVGALVSQVEREAARLGARSVTGVTVAIGELSGVERDLLLTAYEVFRQRTVCEDAVLHVNPVPALWACPRCGTTIPSGMPLRCPACALPARLRQGDEIVLERIEMEVADV